MKKKFLAIILSAVTIASLVTGCSKSQDTPQNESGTAPATTQESQESSQEQVTLTILDGYAGEDPHGKYIYEYADEYMAEHPEVKIQIQAIATNDIYTKLAAMATTPDDLPTIFFTSADAVATLHDLGLTQDLNSLISQDVTDKFAKGVIDSCILNDEMPYFPVALQPQAVIYRKDRFEEAGLSIPSTWDEFIDCAKTLTKDTDNDGQIDQWGFSMVGSNNSSGQSRFMSYLWSNGFDLVYKDKDSDQWKTDISTDKEFEDIFSKWTNMNNVDEIVPTGITEVDYPTSANYFAMGYTSMFLTGSNALGVTYSSNPDLKGKLASFKLPGEYPGTMLGTEGYAISSYASDAEKEAAAAYLEFFVEHDKDMKFWETSGKIPATVEGQKAAYITGEDYAGYLQQIADGCRPTITFAGISGLKSALGNAYSSVFSNESTNEKAVANIVNEITELLEDYN